MVTINEIKNKSKEIFMMYPIKKVSLFGSYATGKSTENSDIDMVIHGADMGLLETSRIRQQLENVFNINIDIVSYEDLSDVFKFLIRDDEVVIYEKQG